MRFNDAPSTYQSQVLSDRSSYNFLELIWCMKKPTATRMTNEAEA